jgi:DNA-binding transcriptional ArsR family regulator
VGRAPASSGGAADHDDILVAVGSGVRLGLPFVATNEDGAIGVLGDPNRRAIFELLARRPSSVGELAELLPITRPAVSQHLKVLKDGGLVIPRAEGNRRVYSLDPDGVAGLRAWLDGVWSDAMTSFHKVVEADPTIDVGDQP